MKKKIVNLNIIMILYAAIILAASLYNISNLYQLYVLHDEFGYWANAAYFAGYDWSGITTISPYYSYGYSFLLALLFHIFHDSVAMYRCALVINAGFYVGSFFLSVWCAKKIFPETNRKILATICLVIALYCNNLLQANLSLVEPLLYFLFWLMLATILKFMEEEKWPYLVCFSLELIYMYTVHQRTLAVLIAGGFTICLCMFSKKENGKKGMLAIGVLAGLIVAASIFKSNLQENMWVFKSASLAGQNDYSGQVGKVAACFTSVDGFLRLIKSFCGKVCYLMISSCTLSFWGVIACIKGVFKKENGKNRILYFFLFLALLLTLGVSSVYASGTGTRADVIFYGRYNEHVIGPILLLGAVYLYRQVPKIWEFVIYVLSLFGTGMIIRNAMKGCDTYTYIQSTGTDLFFDPSIQAFHLIRCLGVAVLIGSLIYFAGRWKKKSLYLVTSLVMIGYWFACSRSALNHEVNICQRHIKDVARITDTLENLKSDAPIYFTMDDEKDFLNWRVENIQFLVPEKEITYIDNSDLENLTGDYFLLQYGADNLDLDKYQVVTQAYGMKLFVPENTELSQQCKFYLKENAYEFANTMMASQTSIKEDTYVSDHKEGFLCFCQDLTLSQGTYEITMELDASEFLDEGPIGYYDVSYDYGEQIVCREELQQASISEDGKAHIVYQFTCEEPLQHAEFRFYSYGNAKVELEKLEYILK